MSITLQHKQEKLCMAHIKALAAMAGLNTSFHEHDYGVDGTFRTVAARGRRLVDSGYAIDFQAKASTQWFEKEAHVVYDLEAKTYNDLATRSPAATTLILILLCLPQEQEDWHQMDMDSTRLKHFCYWYSVNGEETKNTDKKRILIPLGNRLTPDVLKELLNRERQRRLSQRS